MKFTVELDDFWIDEDHNIDSALKEYISNDVVRQIYAKIKDQVEISITAQVANQVKYHLDAKIKEHIDSLIDSGAIKNSSRESESMVDYITRQFNNHSSWNSVDDVVKRLAKDYAENMKKRYDIVFANTIVQKISDQGLLKDEVVKLLLK